MTDRERIAELEECLAMWVYVGKAYLHSNLLDESAIFRAPITSPKSLKVTLADYRRCIRALKSGE